MTCTIMPDGSISTRQKDILEMQAKFDRQLYTSDNEIEFLFKNQMEIKLTQSEKEATDRPLTLEKISQAVKNLRRNRMPGCDGLNPEIFCANGS